MSKPVEGTASVKDEMGGWQWIAGALAKALETKSSRDIAKETGLGHATICRISNGHEPSVSSYFALARWLRPSAAPEAQIEHMVRRFLQWRLPETFRPDAGIKFAPSQMQRDGTHQWPVGTNLFDYEQATAMVRHMLTDVPLAAAPSRDQVTMGTLREDPAGEALRLLNMVLTRLGELGRDDEAGVRIVLANAIDLLRAALVPTADQGVPSLNTEIRPETKAALDAVDDCLRAGAALLASNHLVGSLTPPIAGAGDAEAAIRMMVADHMTSKQHHPGYVLVPTAAFEMAREAIGETE